MGLQALDLLIGIIGLVAEIVLLAVLLVRRQYISFPLFTVYVAFNLFSDLSVVAVAAAYPMGAASALAFLLLPCQYLLDLGVLFEIGCKVLRPGRPGRTVLPSGSLRVFVGLIVVALVWGTLLAWHFQNSGNKLLEIKRPLDLIDGFLRMLLFAAIAGFAQVLGIGWKDKVLQLATALSFSSAIGLVVSLTVRHDAKFSDLDPIRGLAYLFQLVFLVWAFTTKELPRREFSPQMERFLVTLAVQAKVARSALSARR